MRGLRSQREVWIMTEYLPVGKDKYIIQPDLVFKKAPYELTF